MANSGIIDLREEAMAYREDGHAVISYEQHLSDLYTAISLHNESGQAGGTQLGRIGLTKTNPQRCGSKIDLADRDRIERHLRVALGGAHCSTPFRSRLPGGHS
jgi:hypothetical protein